ncbi:hypothetical protein AMTR_s00108p00066140 [Amborella trichopoda]|uniref:SANT domain-containing protein n=1 Tax=Amborella trichopoda TaxID=13333 RepID=W1NUQ1_AMBTC|nr:hypothetical protein AMTR_s00108p00066140 [Amborella trichopoda]
MVFNGWSFQQNKIFGEALAAFPDGLPDRWQEIVGKVAGKSAKEVYMHYEALLKDIKEIDSGKVELPSYNDVSYFRENSPEKFSYGSFESRQVPATCKMGRKKGSPWTEVQHR